MKNETKETEQRLSDQETGGRGKSATVPKDSKSRVAIYLIVVIAVVIITYLILK